MPYAAQYLYMVLTDLTQNDLRYAKSIQGNIIKRVMGLNKRSHHSNLLKALIVPSVDNVIKKLTATLHKHL